jgi:hypothetical protein
MCSARARKLWQSAQTLQNKRGPGISHAFRVGAASRRAQRQFRKDLSHARHIPVFQFPARRCGAGCIIGQPGWLRRRTIAGTRGVARTASRCHLRAECLGRCLRLQCRRHGLDDPGDGQRHAGVGTGLVTTPLIVGVARTGGGRSASSWVRVRPVSGACRPGVTPRPTVRNAPPRAAARPPRSRRCAAGSPPASRSRRWRRDRACCPACRSGPAARRCGCRRR